MTHGEVFVDTSALLAWYHRRDHHHAAAAEVFDELAASGRPLATSSFVLDETLTLLARRAGYRFAAARGRDLYASHRLRILRPTEVDEQRALASFEKLADQRVSFTDCVSFVLMRREGLDTAFSFDRHFAAAGFSVVPAGGAGSAGWVFEAPAAGS